MYMQKECDETISDESKDKKKEGTGQSIILMSDILMSESVKSMLDKLATKYAKPINEYALTEEFMKLEWSRTDNLLSNLSTN